MADRDSDQRSGIEYLTSEEAHARGLREGIEYRQRVGVWEAVMWWPPEGSEGPTEITIRAQPDADPREVARGITTGTLRALPLASITEQIRESQRGTAVLRQAIDETEEVIEGPASYIRQQIEAVPKPGRNGRPDRFFVAAAVIYTGYANLRYPNAIQKLGEACGVDRKAAANWVRMARTKGFLTEPSRVAPGGQLTDMAFEILNEQEN